MAEALDNIFSAIMKSEMIAQVGKQKHKEVKDAIEHLTLRLKKQESQKAEHVAKKSQLELAVADAKIAIKTLKVKEELVTNELKIIEEDVRRENCRFEDVNRKVVDGFGDFIENVKTFSIDYSLLSSGTEKRIQSAKEYLRSLELDKDRLESDLDDIQNVNDELKRILDEKSTENVAYMAMTGKINSIDKEIDAEVSCSNEIENKISQLITEPDHGSEFMRVKEELQAHEVTILQSEVDNLQAQLKTLTRKLHKKESQSLRLQYRHWQRQQNQKYHDCSNNKSWTTPWNLNEHSNANDSFDQENVASASDGAIKEETS